MANTVAGIHLGLDTHANRPAANTAPDGSFYSCSTHNLIYKSNYAGNSWATWANLAGTGFSNPMTNKGELIVGDTAGAASALAAGTSGYALVAAGAGNFPAWAIPRVVVSEGILGSPVTMTNANQYYDGPTLTPAAGKYMFVGKVVITNNSNLADFVQAKLWDGTTVIDETFFDFNGSGVGPGMQLFLTVMGTFTANGSTPVKVSCAAGRAGGSIAIDVRSNSASSHTASRLECWPCS